MVNAFEKSDNCIMSAKFADLSFGINLLAKGIKTSSLILSMYLSVRAARPRCGVVTVRATATRSKREWLLTLTLL